RAGLSASRATIAITPHAIYEPTVGGGVAQGAVDLGSLIDSMWSDGDGSSAGTQASASDTIAADPASLTQAPEARHTESEVYELMSQARRAHDMDDLPGALE